MFEPTAFVRPTVALYAVAAATATATAQWAPAVVIVAGAGAQAVHRRTTRDGSARPAATAG
ncbi:hypothetical protein [Motilibacter deserti]|uniref:Secreted protein n=1 Tax=Motilibacter deserti TaxID=2714956 RepID=A0ABX0GQG3_9ACTN|nr:hypothetical protein [Motilibacter deserti]NHC13078.1 hypothetical protein [Motilibacter deserti]